MKFNENASASSLDAIIANPHATADDLREVIRTLLEMIGQQAATITRLQNEIAELKERLNKNSRNSSKPPSSDGLAKPKPTSLRQKSGKKPGGQKGHIGHGFSLTAPITDTIIHKPEQCHGCPRESECQMSCISPGRNVIDVEITTKVTRHHVVEYACPLLNGATISGRFPNGVNSSMQYGDGVRALAIVLNAIGMVGVERTRDIINGALGLSMSSGTIDKMISRFASTVSETTREIRTELLREPVVNCDETGTRVNGSQCWLHSACNSRFTYLSLQPKRGQEGMKEADFLPHYKGTMIHDCYAPYWSFTGASHGLCGAHLLRELQGVIDNAPTATWAKSMQNLLLEMNLHKRAAQERGQKEIPQKEVKSFLKRYSTILGIARKKNPPTGLAEGKRKKGKARALIDRMIEHKSEVCRFIMDMLTPFTNNLAEQSIRMTKIKNKVSGCFRTFAGGADFSTIMSYLQTAMKRGVNAYTAIRNALAGSAHSTIFA